TKGNVFQMFNSIQSILFVLHFNKAKATALARFSVNGNFCRNKRTKFFKNLDQFIIIHIVREAGNKKFHKKNLEIKYKNNELLLASKPVTNVFPCFFISLREKANPNHLVDKN